MISAEVVQASSYKGKSIWTLNLKYGLIVHAELLRHRLLSHSVKSNRAIEPHRIRKEVLTDPYVPVRFGKNQRGMVANGESKFSSIARRVWLTGRYFACAVHWTLDKLGIHKEVCNRVLNPWQHVRETMTFTEIDNLLNLRLHKDAQPDIQELVLKIKRAIEDACINNQVCELKLNEYHVPYVRRIYSNGVLVYQDNDGTLLNTEQAVQCSVARCARSSYDNHDGSSCTYNNKNGKMRTDKELYKDLLVMQPLHASPAEHVATPMESPVSSNNDWVNIQGITHMTKDGRLWSGNFNGWIQHRHTLNNESCWEYVKTNNHID
jgi:thymidylate synthase ThyX